MTDSTMVVLGMTSLALVIVLYVWFALALAAMFRKMGEPAWKAWVPVLNVATVLQRGDFSPWLVLLNVIPLFGAIAFLIVFIVAVHRITSAFGGGAGLTVLGALVPIVWASVLGWGSARWSGEHVDERSAPARRGRDHAAYVPLIGGWTPESATATEPARSEHDHVDALPLSGPVIVPFAAPTTSLADAVPSPIDWAPRADPDPVSFEERRRSDDVSVPSPDAIPARAVSEVLDALRDDPAHAAVTTRRARAVDVLQGSTAEGKPVASASTVSSESRAQEAPRDGDAADAQAIGDGEPRDRDVPDGVESPVTPWITPGRRAQRAAVGDEAPIADVPLVRPSPEPAALSRPSPVVAGEEFPELSEAVSAVAEAPEAGSPRSARTSVSTLYTQPEMFAPSAAAEDDVDALDRTVVTRRKRIPWMLVPPSGPAVALTSDVVVLGRRPAPDAEHPDAQLVAISDETRTVSKTHARLQLRGDTWFVTDLDSTNGVLFATLMGTEVEAPPGEEIEAGERFFLGDAEVRLARSDA
ncbi:DUF5684 domain-containing protein [Microbacterium sp. VKM Ac-2923]|uniref:DUF5684 domain-containing protein n=1 Tax=Microbacterium sp. VKM Ac-2923 TaxID=2929476 RepID=UPI001FB3EC2C|nr:DUF5684 domain-containing protein [Microbacterium sp. VKM Ac-2923]MCJ1706327.1 DUF5684 domain-containing protein [Microbacterium sp. VKM Ac-2923]